MTSPLPPDNVGPGDGPPYTHMDQLRDAIVELRAYPLDNTILHATHGDDFTATTLNARWTRRNIVAGDETYQYGADGKGLYVTGLVTGDLYLQTAPAGDFSIDVSINPYGGVATQLLGPVIIDSTGAGVGASLRDGNGHWSASLSGYAWSAYSAGVGRSSLASDLRPYWIRLTKSGTSYTTRYSLDGRSWSVATTALTWAGTVDRIGFGCFYADAGTVHLLIRRFNVV